jgi:hypothetical protein
MLWTLFASSHNTASEAILDLVMIEQRREIAIAYHVVPAGSKNLSLTILLV